MIIALLGTTELPVAADYVGSPSPDMREARIDHWTVLRTAGIRCCGRRRGASTPLDRKRYLAICCTLPWCAQADASALSKPCAHIKFIPAYPESFTGYSSRPSAVLQFNVNTTRR